MQAAQLLPGSTRNAAEPTAAGPNAAAVSADTDENEDGRVCVGGLGPCAAVLLNALSLAALADLEVVRGLDVGHGGERAARRRVARTE